MSIQAVAWALEQDLPARPKLVLVSIANHASHTDGYCWLKAETIAQEAACTPRSVYRFIGALVRNGYIRKALRKGGDGKQRANDYWILFAREPGAWVWGAHAPDDDEPQDVGSPGDSLSCGAADGQAVDNPPVVPVEKPVESCGPGDNGVSRYESLEPSKTNPNENPFDSSRMATGLAGAKVPRGYAVPPQQPIGATVEKNPALIFVFEGTRAYEAWARHKAQANGIRRWHRTTNRTVDGKLQSGWYFPTLFPPDDKPAAATGPPQALSDGDLDELQRTG